MALRSPSIVAAESCQNLKDLSGSLVPLVSICTTCVYTQLSFDHFAGEHHVQYQYYLNGAQNHYIGLAQTETVCPMHLNATRYHLMFCCQALLPTGSCTSGALYSEHPIQRPCLWPWFRMGSYSHELAEYSPFRCRLLQLLLCASPRYHHSLIRDVRMRLADLIGSQNYDTSACEPAFACQSQLINIDTSSSIGIYSLSTVDATWQLSINSQGIINEADNRNGFQQTVTVWTH